MRNAILGMVDDGHSSPYGRGLRLCWPSALLHLLILQTALSMHFRTLQIFCDVAAFRSFSRAAAEHSVTQSATSQIVQQLEEQLAVKLIDRSKRPFVLTTEGQYFYKGCRQLVARYDKLSEEVRTLHHEVSGRVRVASIYSAGLSHMNELVKDFLCQNPKANIRVEYQHPDRVYELVEEDQVDLGVVSYPKASRSITATPWREEPMVVVCRPPTSVCHDRLNLCQRTAWQGDCCL